MIEQALSERLPPWVFLYLAPGNPVALANGLGFLESPPILKRGESRTFIKPGA